MEAQAEVFFASIMMAMKARALKVGGKIDYTAYEELMSNDVFVDMIQEKLRQKNLFGMVDDHESKQLIVVRV